MSDVKFTRAATLPIGFAETTRAEMLDLRNEAIRLRGSAIEAGNDALEQRFRGVLDGIESCLLVLNCQKSQTMDPLQKRLNDSLNLCDELAAALGGKTSPIEALRKYAGTLSELRDKIEVLRWAERYIPVNPIPKTDSPANHGK